MVELAIDAQGDAAGVDAVVADAELAATGERHGDDHNGSRSHHQLSHAGTIAVHGGAGSLKPMTRLGVLLNERRSIDTPLVQVCDAAIRDAARRRRRRRVERLVRVGDPDSR